MPITYPDPNTAIILTRPARSWSDDERDVMAFWFLEPENQRYLTQLARSRFAMPATAWQRRDIVSSFFSGDFLSVLRTYNPLRYGTTCTPEKGIRLFIGLSLKSFERHARRASRRILRERAREASLNGGAIVTLSLSAHEVEERRQRLRSLLRLLKERDRAVVDMAMEGFTHAEIAGRLGLKASKVGTILRSVGSGEAFRRVA